MCSRIIGTFPGSFFLLIFYSLFFSSKRVTYSIRVVQQHLQCEFIALVVFELYSVPIAKKVKYIE